MKKTLLLCFLLATAVLAAPAAHAATANFQANCASGAPTDCVFDPTRTPTGQTGTSCAPSTVKRYFWDFDDGTAFFVTPPPHQVGHTFAPGTNEATICVTVFCNDNTSATKCHCFSNVIGIGGCIRPGAGWTP